MYRSVLNLNFIYYTTIKKQLFNLYKSCSLARNGARVVCVGGNWSTWTKPTIGAGDNLTFPHMTLVSALPDHPKVCLCIWDVILLTTNNTLMFQLTEIPCSKKARLSN